MLSENAWKLIKRTETILVILSSLFILLDALTNIIGFAVPTFRFIWNLLILKVPIVIIIAIGLVVFFLIRLVSRKLSLEEEFIISFLDEGERGLKLLIRAYKQAFPSESRTISECVAGVRGLERKKLIRISIFTGGANSVQDELFKLTKRGLKAFKRLGAIVKKQGNDIFIGLSQQSVPRASTSRLEPHEEIVFFLSLVASEANRSLAFRFIEPQYQRQFPRRSRVDFQVLINVLKTNNLVAEVEVGEFGEIGFEILEAGLIYLQRFR
ncbi:MAG: hypothetical protein ABFD52_00685 [Acidobacteriota bacterium]